MKRSASLTNRNGLGVVLIMTLLAFLIGPASPANAGSAVTSKAISRYQEAQMDSRMSDEQKIKAAIDAYFTARYEGQRLLVHQSFSPLLGDSTLPWVRKEQDKREIELYNAKLFGLKYDSYEFTVDLDSIEIEGTEAKVQLRESHEVVFEAIAPEVSKMAGLQHVFTLHKRNGAWMIYGDDYQDELSSQLSRMTKKAIMKRVEESFLKEIDRKLNPGHGTHAMTSPSLIPMTAALVSRTYSGSTAATYADTYWSAYNTNWYKTNSGTDCASFVSQAMYAGEGKTPPDTSGMTTAVGRSYNTDWYYVFNSPKGTQNGSGSLPWIRVQEQYDFIRTNTSKIGPYGYRVNDAGTTYCDIGVGGIAQLYNATGAGIWDHEGMVVQIGDCYTMSQVLVDAHTTNRYHYPLSNWASYSMRFIHISGWYGN